MHFFQVTVCNTLQLINFCKFRTPFVSREVKLLMANKCDATDAGDSLATTIFVKLFLEFEFFKIYFPNFSPTMSATTDKLFKIFNFRLNNSVVELY